MTEQPTNVTVATEAAVESVPTVVETQNSFSVPEQYATKQWATGIKSHDDLWKMTDNAQSLIGRKSIPSQDAPAEEWSAFMKQLGAPENKDGYSLSKIDGLPENFDVAPFEEKAKSLMFDAGLTAKQADSLWKAYIQSEVTSLSESNAQLDAKFGELKNQYFGDKQGEIESIAQDAIKAFVPENLRASLSTASPEVLIAMQALAHNAKMEIDRIARSYGAEGSIPRGDVSAVNADDVVKENARLMASNAYKNAGHPDHKETVERVQAGLRKIGL